jgi:hypothetical protein
MTRATERAYSELQQAFDFYNQRLFDGELDCLCSARKEPMAISVTGALLLTAAAG